MPRLGTDPTVAARQSLSLPFSDVRPINQIVYAPKQHLFTDTASFSDIPATLTALFKV